MINIDIDYKEAKENIVYKKADNVKIPTIAVSDLIKSKQNTLRKQDEADIRYLRRLL